MKTLLLLLASTSLVLGQRYQRPGNSYGGNNYGQGRADVQVETNTNILTISTFHVLLNGETKSYHI